ncbi:MAG: hypothetical protein WDO73_15600 [Ignavibacteriota bacterium]
MSRPPPPIRQPIWAPSKYAFVVLSDVSGVPAAFENQLKDYVRGGGSVLIALGHHSLSFGGKVPVTGQKIVEARYSGRESDRFQVATWLDTSHPSILKNDHWDDVKFLRAIKVDPAGARVVAKLSDQTPLLIDQQIGEGHVAVFASTFDNIDNDFPLHSSFVAFVDQTSRYLARHGSGPPSVMVDSLRSCATPRRRGRRWMWSIPRVSARSAWTKPPRPRTYSSPWWVFTIFAGPMAGMNW